MQTTKIFKTAWLFAVLSIAGWATTQAQTVVKATWTGPASGGTWNTDGNWDLALVPGSDATGITNVLIPFISGGLTSNSVTYNATAAACGGMTNMGALIVSGGNFTNNGIFLDAPRNTAGQSGLLVVNNAAAVVQVNGNVAVTSNNIVKLSGGGTLNISGSLLIGCGVSGGTGSGNSGSIGIMTNSGGFLSASATTINPVNTAGPSQTSQSSLLVISGGTNNLGITTVKRGNGAASGAQTLGTEGLIIYNGLVIMTNLNAGGASGNSWLTVLIAGGTVTNFGNVSINNGTAGRPSRLFQSGGLFVVPDPGVVNPNSTVAGAVTAVYQVTGGTNIVGGFSFGAVGGAIAATVNFIDSGVIYVGSQGIVSNGAVVLSAALNSGGMFGATADWTGSAAMKINTGVSPFTFQAADMDGTPHNITLSGVLSGSGDLNKTGGGILLLSAANTHLGSTLVNGGTLALGTNGSTTSSKIIVGSGSVFDVSAVSGGFVVSNQTLSGSGVVTGAVSVASVATINPGSNTLTGTLSFSNSVTETDGAVNHFDLAGVPNPNNDLIIIAGDLNVSGTNKVDISGALLVPGTNYTIIQYGGNFNGGISNFVVTTALGILTNDATAKTISFISASAQRGVTNTVWIGNPVNTNWDNQISTNWLNASSGLLEIFVPGDSVQFTDAGASNSPVNIVGTVTPTSIMVNSKSNYVFASTSGGLIGGLTTLTVTNTGTLTVLTTNTYTGVTTINGGTLEASLIANSLSPSSIGAASSDPSTLVLTNGGELRYIGGVSTSTDHGISLNGSGGAIGVASGTTLTLNGAFSGSGMLTKKDNGELWLNVNNTTGGGTIVSNGTLTLASGNAAGTGGITNNNGTTLKIVGAFSVPNVFDVNGTVTVDVNNTGGDTALDGAWVGSGTVNVINQQPSSRTFTMGGNGNGGANMANFSGTLNCGTNSGSFRLNDGGGSPNTGSTNMTLDIGTGTATFLVRNGGLTINLGTLRGGTSTSLSGRGSGTAGTVTYSIGGNNSDSDYSGTIKDGGNATALLKVGTGTLTLRGQSIFTGSTTVSNGVLALANNPDNSSDGSIYSTNITIVAGAVIDVSGRSDGSFKLNSPQTLQGNGTVNGILDAQGGGTISPGGGKAGGTGTLTVTGNIYLGPSPGADWMKLNRAASPNSDRLVSSTGGIYHFGEDLIVTNIGAPLQVGDTFTLFSGPAIYNTYNSMTLPGVGNGGSYITWDTSQLAVNGSITVTGVLPHPSVTKADFSGLAGGAITLYATNGIPNTMVNVLSSTNLALPLSRWTTVTNTTFDANGNLVDPTTSTAPFTFLVNPAQTPRFYLLQTFGNSY